MFQKSFLIAQICYAMKVTYWPAIAWGTKLMSDILDDVELVVLE